ncbi:MAG: hypothetical protein E7563_00390 [Ruminococcaceae bacterium]|nr:hypothetical protein [Oscillospiraceae bacterium]
MKDYNEMAEAVFRRRDEFVAARKKRNGIILRTGASLCALLLVAVVGVSVWKALPEIPVVPPTEPETTVTERTDTTGTNEAEDTKPQIDVTESDKNTDPVEKPTDNTKPEGNKKPDKNETTGNEEVTLPQDPTETQKPDAGDTPSAGFPTVTLPQDPTEVTENGDIVEDTTAPSPGVDPTEATLPVWTYAPDTTALPMETIATEVPETTVACETFATEPLLGPLYIECGGKTYEAQFGKIVNLTVELQADEFIKSAVIRTQYGEFGDLLQVIDLSKIGFTDKQRKEAHLPNLGDAPALIDYYEVWRGQKNINVRFGTLKDEEALDFTEKKVLFTFSFLVVDEGNTKIDIIPDSIKTVNGTDYVENHQLVAEGIELDIKVDISSSADIVRPTLPEEEEIIPVPPAEDSDFTYPAESTDGDLVITCQGRKYSADIEDTVIYTLELEADKPIEGIQLTFDYGNADLKLIEPKPAEGTKGEVWFPNLYGVEYDHVGRSDGNNYQIKMNATDIMGFDFKDRKVLMTFKFKVKKYGELKLTPCIEYMYSTEPKDYFFYLGKQVDYENIRLYEYVTVE